VTDAPHDPGTRPIPYPPGVRAEAAYGGPNDCYRYRLTLTWDPARPAMMALMMNPSAAGHEGSDRTVNRAIDFARRWGYGVLHVANSAAYRATFQSMLDAVDDPVGPGNPAALKAMAAASAFILAAYGSPKAEKMRGVGLGMARMLAAEGHKLHVLRLGKDGSPGHPLYVKADTTPVEWRP
jgi:hypothetical protein